MQRTEGAAGALNTKGQLEAALAERDAEIAELQEQVAFERRRCVSQGNAVSSLLAEQTCSVVLVSLYSTGGAIVK